jgi:ribosome maturation factor RimP
LESNLTGLGYELVEVEICRQGGSLILRVFIDKENGGITLDDCSRAAHMLNPVLDVEDLFEGKYLLEVSSPGWNRPIRKMEHFRRYLGETIRIVTEAPIEARTRFKGVIRSVGDDMICLDVDGRETAIHQENIKKARLER